MNIVMFERLNLTLNLTADIVGTIAGGEYNDTPEAAAFSLTNFDVTAFKYFSVSADTESKDAINKIELLISYNEDEVTDAGLTEACRATIIVTVITGLRGSI